MHFGCERFASSILWQFCFSSSSSSYSSGLLAKKKKISRRRSRRPLKSFFFPWSGKLWSFGFTGGYISPLLLLIIAFLFVVLSACCQVLPIFVCGRALARLSVSYVLWNVHGVIRVQRDAVVIRALGQVSDRCLFFWGSFSCLCVCVCVLSLSLSLSRLVCRLAAYD